MSYSAYRRRLLFNRVALMSSVAALPLIVLQYVVPASLADRFKTTLTYLSFVGATFLVAAVVSLLLRYLQGSPFSEPYGRERELSGYLSDKVFALEHQIEELTTATQTTPPSQRLVQELLPAHERERILTDLQSKVEAQVAKAVVESFRKELETDYRREARNREFEKEFARTLQRLSAEVSALGRRGNLNLVIGIVTTVAGLALLGYFVVLQAPSTVDVPSFVMHFIPRLSLVIFVELFAFFFLRLYKTTLSEIKYFQNEMTNVEAKAIALHAAGDLGGASHADVVKSLSQTERNHVLDKGQTTVEIERARLEGENASAIAKVIASAVRPSEKGGG